MRTPRSERVWGAALIFCTLMATVIAIIRSLGADEAPAKYESAPPASAVIRSEGSLAIPSSAVKPPISDEDFTYLLRATRRASVLISQSRDWKAELRKETNATDDLVVDLVEVIGQLREITPGTRAQKPNNVLIDRPRNGKVKTSAGVVLQKVAYGRGESPRYDVSFYWERPAGQTTGWRLYGASVNITGGELSAEPEDEEQPGGIIGDEPEPDAFQPPPDPAEDGLKPDLGG